MIKAWKFLVPVDNKIPLPSNPTLIFSGCVAVVLAATEEDARGAMKDYAEREGIDVRWLEVARVSTIALDAAPCVLSVSMI